MAMAAVKRCLVWALVIGALSAPAQACNVPVFRYALERWPAAPYQALVLHRGAMSDADQLALKLLQTAQGFLEIQTVDLAQPSDAATAPIREKYGSVDKTWLVVRYPDGIRVEGEVVSAPLSVREVQLLLDSPARQAVVRRIIDGEAAVFVLLESGDRKKDDAAAALVETELKRLEKTLELPKPQQGQWDDPRYDKEGPPALRLAFSVLRLSRGDAAEQRFIPMLLGGRPLADIKGPALFPIFGRGRLLCALPGERITKEEVSDIASFLIGPCSCVVKEQNPGVDLFFMVDWESVLAGQASAIPAAPAPALPSTAGLKQDFGSMVYVATFHNFFGFVDKILFAVGLGVLVLVIVLVILRRRARRN